MARLCTSINKIQDHLDILFEDKNSIELSTYTNQQTQILADKFNGVMSDEEQNTKQRSLQPYCHVKLDSLDKLKDSTKKLLSLLEGLQSMTHSRITPDDISNISNVLIPISQSELSTVSNVCTPVINFECQTKILDDITIEKEHDNCSVYKRLTRKCHCLNRDDYNDFVIHFNEDTKYMTTTVGEIIKNIRILKKFLYMGGKYMKNALIFLNEGLTCSLLSEKIEIVQGCSHADICNIFEDNSIVTICISWPCKYENNIFLASQGLAARLLCNLAAVEEGRRYLNFSSKITNDIRKLLRQKIIKLDTDTADTLNETLNLLKPTFARNMNITYYCKSIHGGLGSKTVNELVQYRQFMTLEEIIMYLELLNNLTKLEKGKAELTLHLPALLILFKYILTEYDNSQMNIIVTNIIDNLISKNMINDKESNVSKTVAIADAATEPIKMRNESVQMPPKKHVKKSNKLKSCMGLTPKRHLQQSRHTRDLRSSVIIVPVEK